MKRPRLSIVTPIKGAEARHVIRLCKLLSLQAGDLEHVVQIAPGEKQILTILGEFSHQYCLRVFEEPDMGLYDAIAKGMAKANGELLGWLGVDDTLMPDAVNSVVSCFAANPEVRWLTGLLSHRYEAVDGSAVMSAPQGALGFLQQESMFWHRELWASAQGSDVLRRYKYAADFWLWRAFAEKAELITLCAVLAGFTVRSGQVSEVHKERYLAECGPPPGALKTAGARMIALGATLFPGRRLKRLREIVPSKKGYK